MTKENLPNYSEVDNRREQLRRWINHWFGGNQTAFIASTNDGERQVNQGELSGLLKTKSFGEKRARSLELQAHMPRGYLDSKAAPGLQAEIDTPEKAVRSPQIGSNVLEVRRPPLSWPFHTVTYGRLIDLKRALGQRVGHEALRDIDSILDVVVTKWERVAAAKKISTK